MTYARELRGRWNARSLARTGGLIGLVMALVLAARLIQVQIRPGRAGLGFALAYAALLLVPFVASLAALAPESSRRAAVWMVAGIFAALMSLTSLGGVTLPLLIPAALLVAAGWRSSREDFARKGSE